MNLKGDVGKLIKGVSLSWIRFAISILVGLLQTPVLFKYLSTDELNAWYIFYSFGAFLQMADLGLIQTISRLIAYIDNSSDDTSHKLGSFKPKEVYITAVFSFLSLLFIVGLLIFGVYIFLSYRKADNMYMVLPFGIYIIGMVFVLLSNVPGAMLIGYRDVGPESVVRSIYQVIYFLALLIGMPVFKSLLFVSIFFLLQNIGLFITLHFVFRHRHKQVFASSNSLFSSIKFSISIDIYKQSAPLAINQLGGWLINQGNIFVASLIVDSKNLSDYAITQQIFTYIASLALVINQAMGPFIAKQFVKNQYEMLRQFFFSTSIFCLLMVSILLTIQIICGYEIINLWVGGEHYLGLTLSITLSITTFLEVNHSVGGNFVWNTSSWPFNKWTLAAGLLSVVLGYVFGKEYGYTGIAIAILLAKLVTLNWYVIYFCLNRLGIVTMEYLKKSVYPVIVTVFTSLFLTYNFKTWIEKHISKDILIVCSVAFFTLIIFSTISAILFKNRLNAIYKMIIQRNAQ